MTILSVKLADRGSAQVHGPVLASLPEHLRFWQEGDPAPAVAIMEASSVLKADTDQTLLIADPMELTPATLDQLNARGDTNPILVFPELAPRLVADPLLTNTAQTDWSLLDAVSVCGLGGLPRALFEQLAVLRVLVGELQDHLLLQSSNCHYVVSAITASGAPVTLSASVVDHGDEGVVIDLVALQERVEIVLDLRGSAHPASITHSNATGETRSWPIHQSGQRLAWLDTAYSLTAGQPRWTLKCAYPDLLIARRLLSPEGV